MALTITVEHFPDSLLDKGDDASNHASTMFNPQHDPNEELRQWFTTYLVNPVLWQLQHQEGRRSPDSSDRFEDYIEDFKLLGYQVRNINNPVANSNSLLSLKRRADNRITNISGRADYLICAANSTLADYMYHAYCAIEIQSKNDVELCELQMLTYLFLLMNTRALQNLVGFLVHRDGNCRAYKATRRLDGNVVYEQNDLFHVSYIAEIFEDIFRQFAF